AWSASSSTAAFASWASGRCPGRAPSRPEDIGKRMAVLSSIGVSKEFPGHSANDPSVLALKGVNFTVNHNEFCSVLGHSGCGKTTLLTMIAGFEEPTEGELLLDGKPIGKPGWERSMI